MAQWLIWYSPGFLDDPLQVVAGPRGLRLRDLRLQIDQQSAEIFELVTQVFPGHYLADGQPQRGQLAGQIPGVGLGLRGATTVFVECDPVPVLLTVLGEQNERRRLGGLRGESQIEQDKRVRVPAQCRREQVHRNPCQHQDRLQQQVASGAEETRDGLRATPAECQPAGRRSAP